MQYHIKPTAVPGLYMIENILSSDECAQLWTRITNCTWSNALARRVQHYGWTYDYNTRNALSKAPPIPAWLAPLRQRLLDAFNNVADLDQLIINEYQPGQGIAPHTDHVGRFADNILSVSLGSPINMTFERDDRVVDIWLPVGSVILLSGEARYKWKHSIAKRKTDDMPDGTRVTRSTRISLTFRKVL